MSRSSLASPTDPSPGRRHQRQRVRERLAELGIRPRKALGQHFLHEHSIVQRIVEVAALQPGTLVLEIGPGLGILTEELVRQPVEVIALELDRTLAAHLAQQFRQANVRVVQGDALEVDYRTLTGGRPYVVVANLPYNVATPILERLLTGSHPPTRLVVMVQREVAERMVAAPPHMSWLAVFVQFFTHPRIAFRVGPGAFTPPPKVESAVVILERREPPLPPEEWNRFFQLVHAGFTHRRKQLANALASTLGLDKRRVEELLSRAGIPQRARAETLTLDDWLRLYAAWHEEIRRCTTA